MKTNNSLIRRIGNFFGEMARIIVSGIPRKKVLYKPETRTFLHTGKKNIKIESEKHNHRPMAKPVPEKQTLHKETKKKKVVQ